MSNSSTTPRANKHAKVIIFFFVFLRIKATGVLGVLQRVANDGDELIIVGSGSSSGTPMANCLRKSTVTCMQCLDATRPGSRNKRSNPSALVCIGGTNVLIDCGKSFKAAMLDVFARHRRANHIAAVILTHPHADAIVLAKFSLTFLFSVSS